MVLVIPAQAGIQEGAARWSHLGPRLSEDDGGDFVIPAQACAGMTDGAFTTA